MSLQIHFLRHGVTTAPSDSLIGSTDVVLSGQGVIQAGQLAARLPRGLDCLCSPMLRTRQTLESLQNHGVVREVSFDSRIREIDFGAWERLTFAEISNKDEDIDAWKEYHHFTFPGGESVAHFVARLQSFLDEVQSKPQEQVLVLTHGGVIRTLLCLILGLDIRNYLLFEVKPASWSTVVLYSHGGVLTALNR
ncbi:MAG TPA: histidine phosphatase family protein [Desulfobulbus sp.]|nr:histidine phosphatase family protein [Desulfobulbus sp.]HHD64278.1 histidine phosphatase family protein [Desulfobulbaceae bacterium]